MAIAVVIGLMSAGESGSQVTAEEFAGEVTVEGADLPAFSGDPLTDPTRGRPAPVLSGHDLDGGLVEIGRPGQAQLVSYMASWCPACQEELPELVRWLDDGRLPGDVELVVVSTGLDHRRPNWPPDAWLEEEGYRGPLIVDDVAARAANAMGLSGTPFWVAIDAEGLVALRLAGMLGPEQLDEVADLISGS